MMMLASECSACGQPFLFEADTTREQQTALRARYHTPEDCERKQHERRAQPVPR